MNKKEYYQNKIIYALNKIDYAKSKLKDRKDNKELSKVYTVLLTYGTTVNLNQIIRLTKLSRDRLIPILKELKAYNLIDWDGTYITTEKEIKQKKPDFKEWYQDLMKKLRKDNIDIEDEEVKQEVKPKKEMGEEWVEINYSSDVKLKVKKSKIKEVFL